MPHDPKPHTIRNIFLSVACAVAFIGASIGTWYALRTFMPKPIELAPTTPPSPSKIKASLPGLQLDTSKNYGNKYINGILPVGDGKYTTAGSKKGHIYACSQYAQSFTKEQGGAGTKGPWFINNDTQYDTNKKAHVRGNVSWKGTFSNVIKDNRRTIITNALPLTHGTGIYPINTTDPAYAYDRNPNKIASQDLHYNLNAEPKYGAAQCVGGEVGIMLTGVPLFSAFDAGGRDAGAWEVQDDCAGHPQISGEYHYHTLSSCIKDINIQTVIGFALDGFPITGPQISADNILTTDDLDECHGITSKVMLNDKPVTMYHYVMTQDFPYSVSCFRSTPSAVPNVVAQPPATTPSPQQPAPQLPQGQYPPL